MGSPLPDVLKMTYCALRLRRTRAAARRLGERLARVQQERGGKARRERPQPDVARSEERRHERVAAGQIHRASPPLTSRSRRPTAPGRPPRRSTGAPPWAWRRCCDRRREVGLQERRRLRRARIRRRQRHDRRVTKSAMAAVGLRARPLRHARDLLGRRHVDDLRATASQMFSVAGAVEERRLIGQDRGDGAAAVAVRRQARRISRDRRSVGSFVRRRSRPHTSRSPGAR